MLEHKIQLYCGTGSGRSAAAIGQGIRYACAGKSVFVVCFLKGKASMELDYLKRLEPEIKQFCFDKFDQCYSSLDPEEQAEERIHIQNGIAFARKVLLANECDVLILDEVLDLAALDIVKESELLSLIRCAGDETVVIMTGTHQCRELWPYVSRVTQVENLKETS